MSVNEWLNCDLCWNIPWKYPDLKEHVFIKLPEIAFVIKMILFQKVGYFCYYNKLAAFRDH